MTKLELESTEKKSQELWHVVVEALLNHMQHHRKQLLGASEPKDEWYLGALRRSALTLAMFVDPRRD